MDEFFTVILNNICYVELNSENSVLSDFLKIAHAIYR